MSTRILSWAQMVREADPDFQRTSLRPWTYEFSSGRRFYEAQPVYGSLLITDDFGNPIEDDFGNVIQADQDQAPAPDPNTFIPPNRPG